MNKKVTLAMLLGLAASNGFDLAAIESMGFKKSLKPTKSQDKKPNSAFRGNIVYYTDDNGLIKSVSKKKFSKLPAKYQEQIKKAA